MAQQLVITAIGTDRTGIVSKLARLVTDYNANIIDSRMAVFGNEFTFIMLISGDQAAISKIEYLIPALGLELDLTTMTKRTSARPRTQVVAQYILEYSGPDRVGTLGAITGLLASDNIYIGALQSAISVNADCSVQLHSQMTLEIPEGVQPTAIKTKVMALLAELKLSGTFSAR